MAKCVFFSKFWNQISSKFFSFLLDVIQLLHSLMIGIVLCCIVLYSIVLYCNVLYCIAYCRSIRFDCIIKLFLIYIFSPHIVLFSYSSSLLLLIFLYSPFSIFLFILTLSCTKCYFLLISILLILSLCQLHFIT